MKCYAFQAKDTTQHNPTYAYDNKVVISSENVAESGEVKPPATYYNLQDKDLREGNGTASGAPAGLADPVNKLN